MTERTIRCTHTGSLPCPDCRSITTMWAAGDGVPVDAVVLEEQIDDAVREVAYHRSFRAVGVQWVFAHQSSCLLTYQKRAER